MLVTLHVIILCLTLIVVFVADKEGFSYIRGRKVVLDRKRIDRLHYLIFTGLTSMILTGGLMVWPYWSFYIADTVFRVKMLFVLALIINTFFISILSRRAVTHPFTELSKRQRIELFISGGVSICGWLGAITAGLLLG